MWSTGSWKLLWIREFLSRIVSRGMDNREAQVLRGRAELGGWTGGGGSYIPGSISRHSFLAQRLGRRGVSACDNLYCILYDIYAYLYGG